MKILKNIFSKIYASLFFIGAILLTLIGLIVMSGPFYRGLGSSILSNIFYGLLLPIVFIIGRLVKKYVSVSDILLVVGCCIGVLVLISSIATWIQYGFFHTLIYKDTPIYYLNGAPYNVTKEALFFSSFSFQTVTVNYFSLYGVLAGCYLPGAFFVDRKNKKLLFILSFIIGIVGITALASLPNLKALLILLIVSLFALLYKFYWQNKKVINIVRWTIVGLFALAIILYSVAGINASFGFKLTGFLEKLVVKNPIMNKVSDVLAGMNIKDGNALVNLFGLNFNYVISSEIEYIATIKTGIFEVELLKEIGVFGVSLMMLFITVSFVSYDRQLSNGENTDFERIVATILFAGFFIYASLFYDSMPYVYHNTYVPFLRFLPFLIILFLLGMCYFQEEKNKEAVHNEK